MMSFLPWYYQDSKIMTGIMKGDAEEIEAIRADIMRILSYFFVSTAPVDGIKLWEEELGITPAEGAGLELRRAQVQAKLQRPAIMTPKQIESIVNLFTKAGGAKVTEVPGRYHFHIKIPFGDLLWPTEMKEAVEEAKPAHIGFDVALKWGRLFLLNSSGGIDYLVTPEKKWTEEKTYYIFDLGLNAAGATETVTTQEKKAAQHTSYTFPSGTTNGRLRLNDGAYSSEKKDIGWNVTQSWLVFSGSRMNSRASPRLNDSPVQTKSKTVHVADWREVVNRHGNALNAAGGGTRKNWTTESVTTKKEKRFVKPLYTTNCIGTITSQREDIGKDIQLEEVIFSGSCTNSGKPQHKETQTKKVASLSYTLFAGSRLNGKSGVTMNRADPQEESRTEEAVITVKSSTFLSGTLNGRLRTNGGKPGHITRIVHIPIWRDVITRHGGTILNAARHTKKSKTITHVIPAKTEKRFNSTRGTLLNGKAVMGYLTI